MLTQSESFSDIVIKTGNNAAKKNTVDHAKVKTEKSSATLLLCVLFSRVWCVSILQIQAEREENRHNNTMVIVYYGIENPP